MGLPNISPPDVTEAMKNATQDNIRRGSNLGDMTLQQKTSWIRSEYDQRESITLPNRRAEVENHEMFTGLFKGQWPKTIIEELESSGRIKDLTQFNIVARKVDGLVGYILQNWYDAEFLSVTGEKSDILSVVKDLYYSDKEICDWDRQLTTFLRNGAIKTGWLMMEPNYTADPQFGNIGLRALPPGMIMPDPNWVTDHSGDMRNCFTLSYLTPTEIKNKYRTKSDHIDTLIKQNLMNTLSDQDLSIDAIPRYQLEDEYNKHYRVIEYHHMVAEERETKMGLSSYGQSIRIPEGVDEEWYQLNDVDPATIMTSKEQVDVYYITTIVPEIDSVEPVEDRPGFYQLGRLPLFHWSFMRHNGSDVGMVDFLRDPQQYFNQMLSLTHEMIAHSRRAKVVDWGMFDESAMNADELKQKFLDPNEIIFTKPDATNEFPNGIQEAGASQATYNEQGFATTILGMTDKILPMNSAMEGLSEGQRQSGDKFESEVGQGEVVMTMIRRSVAHLLNEVSTAYFYAFKGQYGGMYREFYTDKGKIELNKVMPDGRIWNDVSTLPRARVVVTESPTSETRRVTNRHIGFRALEKLGGNLPLIDLEWNSIIYNSMDDLTVAQKEKFEQAVEAQRIMLQSSTVAQTANNEFATVQAQAQTQQLMQPPPQAPPQGAEGAPQGGEQQIPPEQALSQGGGQ
jgi:hypothetical protein